MINTGCNEYDLIKNRYQKKSLKYKNKTARVREGVSCSCCWNGPETLLEHPNLISKDGVVTQTRVDHLFGSFNNQIKSLGKRKLWESVMQELNDTAVEVREKFSYKERSMHKIYSIPVISRTTIKNKSGPHTGFGAKWLAWKGVSYDPAKLYVVDNSSNEDRLKTVCVDREAPSVFPADFAITPIPFRLSKANNEHVHSSARYTISIRESATYQAYNVHAQPLPLRLPITPENCLANGIIIDLKSVHLLTHLAVRGTMPTTVDFPRQYYGMNADEIDMEKDPATTVGMLNMRRRRRHRRRGCSRRGGHVQVLRHDPTELPHVTSFDLYRKELGSGQWIKVVSSLHIPIANYGITSALVDLKSAGAFNCSSGLRSRFIKLVPTSWHISPVFRVMVYGKKLDANSETTAQLAANKGIYSIAGADTESGTGDVDVLHRKSTRRQLRNETRDHYRWCLDAAGTKSNIPVETVRYTLKPAVHANWKLDGTYRSYKDSYSINERRQFKERFIRDCIRDYDALL